MMLRILPGLTASLALALGLCWLPDEPAPYWRLSPAGEYRPVQSSISAAGNGKIAPAGETVVSACGSGRTAAALAAWPAIAGSENEQPPAAAGPAQNISLAGCFPAAAQSAPAGAARTGREFFSSSGSAYANLEPGTSWSAGVRWDEDDFPEKGIRAFGAVSRSSVRQGGRDLWMSRYETRTTRSSIGILYDWSVDSSFGISMDIVDAAVKSRHPGHSLKNDINGHVFSANYDGLLSGKFPVIGSVFYGRLSSRGRGLIADAASAVPDAAWNESKHASAVMGFRGKIGAPLIWGDDFKVLPEVGIEYLRLKSRAYDAEIEGAAAAVRLPDQQSSAFAVPVTLTVKKDYLRYWGLITPRAGFGLIVDYGDTAALHGYNSTAATRIFYDSPTATISAPVYDGGQRLFWQLELGADLKTIGGWELSAAFQRVIAEKYRNDTFRLELAKCF